MKPDKTQTIDDLKKNMITKLTHQILTKLLISYMPLSMEHLLLHLRNIDLKKK